MPPSPELVQRLFHAACELPPGAREAFLREQTAGDAELRAEVEALLAADSRASLFGDSRLAEVREQLAGPGSEAPPPEIQGFEVFEVIGRGGMGVVHRARQLQPPREVALKLLTPVAATAEARARFALEAEALGRLRHPGIAQIFASGSCPSPSGEQPFLAMELVRGEPLHRWAQQRAPDLAARVRVLVEICDAVHHAHQQGLIHRDLKPGNVLIDEAGHPRVLDFGIARFADADRERSLRTLPGQVLGTVAYMSPEQANGRHAEVDVRTDVYAVGVLAYELLSGRLPIDIGADPLTTALRRVVEEEPAALGTVAPESAGDLERIVAMAMRKEPERRYASMAALGDDLRRFLAHEPVMARPATLGYVMTRFARRHRGLVAGAVVAALALAGGTAASVWWALVADAAAARAVVAEGEAREEARLANEVTLFVEGLFTSVAPEVAQGRTVTAKEVVERGAGEMQKRLAGQPLVRARLSRMLGQTLAQMGQGKDGAELADAALATLREKLPADDPLVLEALVTSAQCHFLARDVLGAAGRFEEARGRFEAAREVPEVLWLRVHEGLGACALDTGNLDQALAEFTLVQQKRAADPDPAVRAKALVLLANVYNRRKELQRAEQLFEQAHGELQKADDPVLAGSVATNLGVLRINQERLPEAEALFREALAAGEKQFGADSPRLLRRLCNVAAVLSMTDRNAEAGPLLERALQLAEKGGAETDDGLANVAINLGNVRRAAGRFREALVLYERAAAIYERLGGKDSPELADALENEAEALDGLGETAKAEALRARVAAIRGR